MYLKRNLLFVTILLVFFISLSCFQNTKKTFSLLESTTISSFPSASAVEFYNNKLYVFGDDAAHLLILDTNFNVIEKIFYADSISQRISPDVKPDIESTTIKKENGRSFLYAVG